MCPRGLGEGQPGRQAPVCCTFLELPFSGVREPWGSLPPPRAGASGCLGGTPAAALCFT